MAEQPPRPEEKKEGREFEVEQLVLLNELIEEMYNVATSDDPRSVSDAALGVLSNLCIAMARRDPELGCLLVFKLSDRVYQRAEVSPEEADRHEELAVAVNQELLETGQVQPGWLDEQRAQTGWRPPSAEPPPNTLR